MRQPGSINATGTAFVLGRGTRFTALDTPRAIGNAALEAGHEAGDILTVHTCYPGFPPESREYVLTVDAEGGFAERL